MRSTVLVVVGLLVGCGDDKKAAGPDGPVVDAAVDAAPDASPDAGLPDPPPLPAHCTGTLTGDVTVTNSLQLAQIVNYTTITGSVTINVPGLATVDLPCIQHVGGTLRIFDTEDVVDVELVHLEDVDTLLVRSAALQKIDLQSLVSVPTRAVLTAPQVIVSRLANAGALSISGGAVSLPSLVEVGAFGIDSNFPISAPLVQTIGSLSIGSSQTANVTTVSLPAATSVAGDLTIDGRIQTLSMPMLATVGGTVFAKYAPDLLSLSGLAAVTSTHGVATCFAPKLASLGMTSLNHVYGNLHIGAHTWATGTGAQSCSDGAPLLASLNLPALTKVDGRLVLHATGLANLNSLNNLAAVDGHLIIEENAQLTSLAALSALVAVGDQLILRNNPVLATVGLAALRSVSALCPCGGGSYFPGFHVQNNPQLPTCDAVAVYNGLTTYKPPMQYATFVNNKAPTTCP